MKIATKCLAIFLILSMTVACTTDQILTDLNLVLQIAVQIIPAVMTISPTDGAAIQQAANIASNALSVIEVDYKTYKASGATTDLGKLEAALDAFKGNLNAAIAAARIVDPASKAKVLAWASLIYSVTDAILNAIPQAKVVTVKRMTLPASLPKPSDIKARWKQIQG